MGGGGGVREKVMIAQRIDYAHHYSRSHDAVIRVYDAAGNMIATHDTRAISKSREALLVSLRTSGNF
jgi:hypothetical protein